MLALPLLGAAAARPDPLDAIARDYVHLSLEAGEREPGYVDAYYGPPAWAAAAKAHPRSIAELRKAAHALWLRANAVAAAKLTPLERKRRAFLIGQLKAAETRLAMDAGEKFSFDDEAEGLFGLRPELAPLESLDAALAEVDRLVPGEGPLWQRVDQYKKRFDIPADRLDAVMRAAIAECRWRTMAHIALPPNEKFTLEFVKLKPWGGYNFYKGNAVSLIQINTDLPVNIDRAIDYGCHEGYPGHHVYNLLLERNLATAKGWIEFTVYPLYSPQSFIARARRILGSISPSPATKVPGSRQTPYSSWPASIRPRRSVMLPSATCFESLIRPDTRSRGSISMAASIKRKRRSLCRNTFCVRLSRPEKRLSS